MLVQVQLVVSALFPTASMLTGAAVLLCCLTIAVAVKLLCVADCVHSVVAAAVVVVALLVVLFCYQQCVEHLIYTLKHPTLSRPHLELKIIH